MKVCQEVKPDAHDVQQIRQGLGAYNAVNATPAKRDPLFLFLRAGDGTLVGGLLGKTSYGWLFVRTLWVAEELRGQGWGRRLLEAAEAEAIRRGCHAAWLDTFTFQAPTFYERMGYAVFGVLDGFPLGQQRLFMRKTLAPCVGGGA